MEKIESERDLFLRQRIELLAAAKYVMRFLKISTAWDALPDDVVEKIKNAIASTEKIKK
mgnify:CR=1 FL=1